MIFVIFRYVGQLTCVNFLIIHFDCFLLYHRNIKSIINFIYIPKIPQRFFFI